MEKLIIVISVALGCISLGTAFTCPAGWKQSSIYCYYFNNNDTVSWLEAQNECQMRLATLLSIESTDEYNYIKSNMVNNPSGNGFWTSLNDRDPSAADPDHAGTGTWLWGTSSYPLDSILKANWDKEPDNNDDEDCIAINLAATLSDEHCSSKMGYICELDNNGGGCPLGWLIGPNDCFFVSNVSDPTQLVTWDTANNLCQNKDTGGQGKAYLVTLDTPDDSNYFTINMPTSWSIQTTQKWWTDLSDKQTEGTYKWMNGATYNPQYVNWTQEPNDIMGREHCGTILQKGTFSDRDCSQHNNYICRRQQPNQQYTTQFGCGDWERAGHKCYQVVSKPQKSWSDASSYCQSVGGRLMKIENRDEMSWLSYQSQTSVMSWGGYWIGLTDSSSSKWLWADGSAADTSILLRKVVVRGSIGNGSYKDPFPMRSSHYCHHNLVVIVSMLRPNFLNFDHRVWNQEPNDFNGNEDCGAMGTDGVFSDWACKDMRNGFLCEKPKKNQNCPTGWVSFSTSCYFVGSQWKTYKESMDLCKSLSGDGSGYLLILNTQDEKTFVLSQLDKLTKAPFWFWTGLTDIITEGLWQYNNPADNTATALSLVVWNAEPNNWHGEEHCVATAFGGRLNDMKCGSKSGFICEKAPAGYTPYGGAGQPTSTFSKLMTVLSMVITIAMKEM